MGKSPLQMLMMAMVMSAPASAMAQTASLVPTPPEIIARAPAGAWRAIAPENLVVMELGNGKRIVIELAPDFAPVHVANIRTLIRGGWFDRNAIIRVQDNYVVQWGGADPKRSIPKGVVDRPPPEYERPLAGLKISPSKARDVYASTTGFADGWPMASDGRAAWLTHCYAMVGVGRDLPPDTGNGAELYTVIGHAPRHLDRNIALVGRIVDGMDVLSALPRGTGEIGFYTDAEQNVPIARTRLAADWPGRDQPHYQVMRTDTAPFAEYADARANRRDDFFIRPAGGADVCNVPVPTRKAP